MTENAAWLYSLALTLPLVLLVDKLFGEPPAAVHPVTGMGRLLDVIGHRLPYRPPGLAFFAGAFGWWVGAIVSVSIAVVLQYSIVSLLQHTDSILLTALLLALFLKPLLSLRMLLKECLGVEIAIGQSLQAGRTQTARICSRDTGSLDETALRETAVESLAENFTDSVVAPLFWFAIAGLPGAALYRWANTADAMWGYRDVEHEWSGKFAARFDDLLNWLPARLSALALWPAGHVQSLLREACKTPSPNGGWPMAATALKLGVSLGKPGIYTLNAKGRSVDSRDIAFTTKLVHRASWSMVAVLALALTVSAWV